MESEQPAVKLTRYAWLSILASILTIGLKLGAYWLTNSVGLLSDALESFVNLATAIVALVALSIATRPADEEFAFGYSKMEFFSSGFEGGMILIAAGAVAATAIPRLIHPQPLEQVGLGLAVSVVASLINLGVSRILARAGRRSARGLADATLPPADLEAIQSTLHPYKTEGMKFHAVRTRHGRRPWYRLYACLGARGLERPTCARGCRTD